MDFDKNLINTIKNSKKDLEEKKAALEKKKSDLILAKSQVDAQYKQLQSDSQKKKDKMIVLQNDRNEYQKMIDEEQAESKEIGSMIKKIEDAKKAAEEANKKKKQKPNTANGLFCVTGTPYVITSPYGWRIHPIRHTKIFHAGIDIGVPMGTPIHALKDGTVIYASWMSGYGNVVMIDHGDLISLYAHNSSLTVQVGDSVKGGQVISYSGSTGNSTGPHLHFEIRLPDGNTIDPMPYYVK